MPSPEIEPKTKTRRVVVICPGEVVSGGPEALHQLGAALIKAGQVAEMCYFPFDKAFAEGPPQYHDYDVPVCQFDEIGDADVVLPEARTGFARLFRPDQVWIWWLSVNHYGGALTKDAKSADPDRHLPLWQMHDMHHLSQSAYATAFLNTNGLASFPLGDYLVHAHRFRAAPITEKERIVLYNPKKGRDITQTLIDALPQEKFHPIIDLDHAGVAQLLERAALYVDFGPHPGKDRLPREAAMAGCCVVTGRQGAAGNADDVAIPEAYKVDEQIEDFSQVAGRTIVDILDHWDTHQPVFDAYRRRIAAEEGLFVAQVKRIFAATG